MTAPVEDLWAYCLRTKLLSHLDSFTSQEALSGLSGSIEREKVWYSALKLDDTNNENMKRVYTLRYEARKKAG